MFESRRPRSRRSAAAVHRDVCTRHVNETGARGYLLLPARTQEEPQDVGAECDRIDLGTRAVSKTRLLSQLHRPSQRTERSCPLLDLERERRLQVAEDDEPFAVRQNEANGRTTVRCHDALHVVDGARENLRHSAGTVSAPAPPAFTLRSASAIQSCDRLLPVRGNRTLGPLDFNCQK